MKEEKFAYCHIKKSIINSSKIFVFLFFLLGIYLVNFSQQKGYKFLRNYTDKEYNGLPQNWCVLQDQKGFIYVGNHGGLMQYDGVSWRTYNVPNRAIRSMDIYKKGKTETIFFGGKSEMGYFTFTPDGVLQYHSLMDQLQEKHKKFNNVWKTHATPEGIYFRSNNFLFRWNPIKKKMKVWEPQEDLAFNASFIDKEELILHIRQKGLFNIINDNLELIPGSDALANVKIYMLAPYDQENLFIGTERDGFFLFNPKKKKVNHFPTEADPYINEYGLYHGIRLSTGEFAMATYCGGLVIMDAKGKLKDIYTIDSGLQNNEMNYVFEDCQGNLWLCLTKGLTKIEYNSPLTVFDQRANLPDMILSVIKHKGILYAGTSNGLYYLDSLGKFIPIPGDFGFCWHLVEIDDSIFAATDSGIFIINQKNISERIFNMHSKCMVLSQQNPNRLWVGTEKGLVSLRKQNLNQWKIELQFNEIYEEIYKIVEDQKGNLWLSSRAQNIIHVQFLIPKKISDAFVTRYNENNGLPASEIITHWAAGNVRFCTKKGIYHFDDKTNFFTPDMSFRKEFTQKTSDVYYIGEDKKKNIWINSNFVNFQLIPHTEGSYIIQKSQFLRIPSIQTNYIFPEPENDIIWFATYEGLFRYDDSVEKNYQKKFSAYIRKILVNENAFTTHNSYAELSFNQRNLRFEFAAPFFEDETSTTYQYYLEGHDPTWSKWSKKTEKDYPNLDSGEYTFHVRAKNVFDHISQSAEFQFKILPPWYRSWWALTIYALLATLFIFLIVKWRSWKLIKEKKNLEEIIKDRTREINDKNAQLQDQTLQLKEQSDKLKEIDQIKSRFFANISHEFRTPLTLIMGPLEQMITNTPDVDQQNQLNLMLKNSQRLLNLINQLLDLSKIDSGKLKLHASCQNIIPFLKEIMASFEILTQQRQQKLKLMTPETDISLFFDQEKIEKVLCNLIINAIKFTPPKGTITIQAEKINKSTLDNLPPSQLLQLSITDTGKGIPRHQLEHIFDRFFQASASPSDSWDKTFEGTGIGLALSKELITLHHGTIDVKSTENKGTSFIIKLPLGKDHLSPEEIIEFPHLPPSQTKTRELSTSLLQDDETLTTDQSKDHQEQDSEDNTEKKNIILVVDDNKGIRDYMRRSLEPEYQIEEGANGDEGIQKAKELIPDLIISDVMMPITNGIQLCNHLKKTRETSHIPIILLTAKASEDNIIEGLETGADDYITKPFNTKILCSRIKNLIELRRQFQLKIQREKEMLPNQMAVSNMDETFLKEFQDIIEKNLSDGDFNVENASKKMLMGRSTLYRKIEALTGQSPKQFIQSYRLQRAAQLLKTNFGNITEVAYKVGFSSSAYFTKCFKDKYHQVPSVFMESQLPARTKTSQTIH